MKKYILPFALFLSICGCSDENNSQPETKEISAKEIQMFSIPDTKILNQEFSFNSQDSDTVYNNKNEIISAINGAIKCTINPKNKSCTTLNLPKFILMEDESLQRPSFMQYQITKIKPLAGGLLHIYTKSQCNNNWFGLCQGNIIYVLENKNNQWYVSDIFALAK